MSILVSGFISLSLTPMLCSRYLRPPHEEKHGRVYVALGRILDGMNWLYEASLKWVMKHHVTTMAASAVVLVATIYMFGLVPKGFIPSEDIGQIIINTEGAQGVSFEQMVQYQQQVAALVGKEANVESFFSSVGVGGASLTGTPAEFLSSSRIDQSGPNRPVPMACSANHADRSTPMKLSANCAPN